MSFSHEKISKLDLFLGAAPVLAVSRQAAQLIVSI